MILIMKMNIDTWTPLNGNNEIDLSIEENLFDIYDECSHAVDLGI